MPVYIYRAATKDGQVVRNRVEEINRGEYDELIEQIMQKPITEMQELYNNREIEK